MVFKISSNFSNGEFYSQKCNLTGIYYIEDTLYAREHLLHTDLFVRCVSLQISIKNHRIQYTISI